MHQGPIERELECVRHSGRVDKQLLADRLGVNKMVAVLQERGVHVVHHAWRTACEVITLGLGSRFGHAQELQRYIKANCCELSLSHVSGSLKHGVCSSAAWHLAERMALWHTSVQLQGVQSARRACAHTARVKRRRRRSRDRVDGEQLDDAAALGHEERVGQRAAVRADRHAHARPECQQRRQAGIVGMPEDLHIPQRLVQRYTLSSRDN